MNGRRSDGNDGGADLSRVAVAVAAATTVGIGVASGAGTAGPILLAAAAGLATATGTSLLGSRSIARLSAGSCGLVGGLALVCGAIAFGATVAPTSSALAGGAVAAAATTTGGTALALVRGTPSWIAIRRSIRDSTVAAVIVAVVATAVLTVPVGRVLAAVVDLVTVATVAPFAGFVTLQILAAATVVLLALVAPRVESILSEDVPIPTVGELVERVVGLPTVVHYAFAGQFLLWFAPATPAAFESALGALGPVGLAVSITLTSGLLHVTVALVFLVAVATAAAVVVVPFARTWLEPYPLQTCSLAAGGTVATLGFLVAGAYSTTVGPVTAVWIVPALLGVAVVVEVSVSPIGPTGASEWRWRRRSLAVGGASLFAATAVGAMADLPSPAVFAGVAATLFVWDVGENALSTRRAIGAGVDTRETELVHATGSGLVALVGVGLAAIAAYGIGSVVLPIERWQAVASLALALVALVAFVLAVIRTPSVGELGPARAADLVRRFEPTPVWLALVSIPLVLFLSVTVDTRLAPIAFFVLVVALVYLRRDHVGQPSMRPPR